MRIDFQPSARFLATPRGFGMRSPKVPVSHAQERDQHAVSVLPTHMDGYSLTTRACVSRHNDFGETRPATTGAQRSPFPGRAGHDR
jgi:hypothetical protein